MPSNKDNQNSSDQQILNPQNRKIFNRSIRRINDLLGRNSLEIYGTDRNSEITGLNDRFQDILKNEINSLNNKNNEDITSFVSKLYSSDKKFTALDEMLNNQFLSATGSEKAALQGFLMEQYKNRLMEQNDLHEVASQLIELSEAILITRDAIISADIVEGRMARTIKFADEKATDMYKPVVEVLEKKFELQEKIKNFIVPKTLEYGEYYAYVIPYSKLFSDFMKNKDRRGKAFYHEHTLLESTVINNDKKKPQIISVESFLESSYRELEKAYNDRVELKKHVEPLHSRDVYIKEKLISMDDYKKEMTMIFENISVCNDSVPLPFLEEGDMSIESYKELFINEAGDSKIDTWNPYNIKADNKTTNLFDKINDRASEGITYDKEFAEIRDCYVKLIDPTKLIPVKIMDSVIGYYYVQAQDIAPLPGSITNTLYFNSFDQEGLNKKSFVDTIVDRIIASFDKKFLKDNINFKKEIADAIQYYNINKQKLRFQFIPAEFICPFKIDKDVEGNGQSMIKKSLFYAKLYLMLLLFKMMSIILYSNDQRVNYVRTSGIDKDVANKVQEIARIKQNRQINILDLFSYTTLVNKIGNGFEQYIPTGRSGERPIETEILAGQDVQLNTELMEMLKNSYILATGVPAAILNYLNEADFAKEIEQHNTKFNGRIVNYQLDFNPEITEFYKRIMKHSTNIDENIIDGFEFTLQPPKTVAASAKTEAIQNFQQLVDFLIPIYFDDPNNTEDMSINEKIKQFKKLMIAEYLPMLDIDKLEDIAEEATRNALAEKLKPRPENGDADLGLTADLAAIPDEEAYPGETGGEEPYPGETGEEVPAESAPAETGEPPYPG